MRRDDKKDLPEDGCDECLRSSRHPLSTGKFGGAVPLHFRGHRRLGGTPQLCARSYRCDDAGLSSYRPVLGRLIQSGQLMRMTSLVLVLCATLSAEADTFK